MNSFKDHDSRFSTNLVQPLKKLGYECRSHFCKYRKIPQGCFNWYFKICAENYNRDSTNNIIGVNSKIPTGMIQTTLYYDKFGLGCVTQRFQSPRSKSYWKSQQITWSENNFILACLSVDKDDFIKYEHEVVRVRAKIKISRKIQNILLKSASENVALDYNWMNNCETLSHFILLFVKN